MGRLVEDQEEHHEVSGQAGRLRSSLKCIARTSVILLDSRKECMHTMLPRLLRQLYLAITWASAWTIRGWCARSRMPETITCRLAPFRGLHMGFQSHPALHPSPPSQFYLAQPGLDHLEIFLFIEEPSQIVSQSSGEGLLFAGSGSTSLVVTTITAAAAVNA